jgi:hypothetical protein
MTAAIIQMKHLLFVQTSIVTHYDDFNVPIIVALPNIKYAMVMFIYLYFDGDLYERRKSTKIKNVFFAFFD